MLTGLYCFVVASVLFLLVIHSMQVEDNRDGDRRRQDLPHPVERRRQQRRKGRSTLAFLRWAARALWS